jgi:hypothetical protein
MIDVERLRNSTKFTPDNHCFQARQIQTQQHNLKSTSAEKGGKKDKIPS